MNLVQLSALTRKLVVAFIAFIVIFLFGWYLRGPTKALFLAIFPPKDLPTLAFGILEPLEFTQSNVFLEETTYTLNTRTGKLPADIPINGNVYKFKESGFSYSAGANAQKDAKTLGFTDDMRVSDLTRSIFKWEDVSFGGKLFIDTNNDILELTTPMIGKGTLYPGGKLTRISAIATAKEMLQTIGRFSDVLYSSDIAGYQEVTFGKFGPNGLVEANSTLEAQVAKVDFFRQINDIPVVGSNPKEGLIQVVLREKGSQNVFPQLSFPYLKIYHWEIDPVNSATYPLIPVFSAWEQVSQGGGAVSAIIPSGTNPFESVPVISINQIIINEIYLGYYDSKLPQKILQPIYVFEGSYKATNGTVGNIYVYYPAISGEYVQSNEPVQPSQL